MSQKHVQLIIEQILTGEELRSLFLEAPLATRAGGPGPAMKAEA